MKDVFIGITFVFLFFHGYLVANALARFLWRNHLSCWFTKPVEVKAHDSFPVSQAASPACLYLPCMPFRSAGDAPSQPIATLQPMPPRAPIAGRWPLAGGAFYEMRKAPARRPSPEVLARCLRQRQSNAIRATA